MDSEQFREFGKTVIDFIADYLENIRERPVIPSVQPGYLKKLIPNTAPEEPEPWQNFLDDVERVIMPGMLHWGSPRFHGYYPAGNSYPSIVGELLSAGLGVVGFTWSSSPACTELEVEVMNWLGKLLGLPEEFLNCSEGPGGGVIQGSACEATLVVLLAAKDKTINRLKKTNPDLDESLIANKLVAYTSNQSNSSVEKAGKLASVTMRLLPVDDRCRWRGNSLQKAIEEDIAKGLIPCFATVSLGTTSTCAFDCMEELGPICQKYDVWMHIDAAYAGAAFICPEYRFLMSGIEYADSFDFNPHKWMLVNFDCSTLWVRNSNYLIDTFDVQRLYFVDSQSASIPDYRHWQIPLSRRFKSIKLWAVMRLYGASGIRNYIREQVDLAQQLESYILADDRFKIVTEVNMALVCFKLKGDNQLTKLLFEKLYERKNIFISPGTHNDEEIIRFCVSSRMCKAVDIEYAWKEISSQATEILNSKDVIEVSNVLRDKLDILEDFNAIKLIYCFLEKTKNH